MSTKKIIRDAIIIIVIVVAAVVFFGSRQPGPADRLNDTAAADDPAAQQNMPRVHGEPYPEIGEGDPLVKLSDHVIGSEWYDRIVADHYQQYLDEGSDDETAMRLATFDAFLMGLQELVIRNAIDEFGIVPDEEMVAEQEEMFHSSFESTEDSEELLSEMGMAMQQVRTMWEDRSIMTGLFMHIAEMEGVDAGSEEAEQVMEDWIRESVLTADYNFMDPEMEAMYESYRTAATEGLTGEDPVDVDNSAVTGDDSPADSQ